MSNIQDKMLPRNNIRFNFSGKTSNEIIFWEILVGEKKNLIIIHQKSREFLFLLIFRLESCQRFEALFHPAYSSQSFRQKLSTLIEIQLKIVHKLMKIIFLNSNNISFVINSTLIFFEKNYIFWIWKNKFMYLSYFCKNWALCCVQAEQ